MFQIKISAAIFVVVVAIMGFAYYALTDSVTESVVRSQSSELEIGQRAVSAARTSAEQSLTRQVLEVTNDEVVGRELAELQQLVLNSGGIEPLKDQLRRQELFDALLDWNSRYAAQLESLYGAFEPSDHEAMVKRSVRDWWGSAPDLVLGFVATPLKGQRIGHHHVAFAEEGQEIIPVTEYSDSLPVLKEAEEGPASAFITWRSHEYFAVAGPVLNEAGELMGTIVLGYQLDASLAERLGAVGGGEVTIVVYSGKRLYAPDAFGNKDALRIESLFPVVLGADEAAIDEDTEVSLSDTDDDTNYVTTIDDNRFMLQRASWIAADDETGSEGLGFFILSDLGAAMQPVDELKYQIPLVGVVMLIVALLITTVIIRRFLKPLEDIDVGIQEILAGNREYLFRARPGNPLHGELVNSLNQLTAYLQGRAGPGEADQEWDEMLVDLEPERPSIYGMQAVQMVRDESERAQLRALYDEYMGKRRELDQHVDMDFDRFCRRIKRNETSLKEKHDASSVDFGVAVSDGKVVLKPTLHFD